MNGYLKRMRKIIKVKMTVMKTIMMKMWTKRKKLKALGPLSTRTGNKLLNPRS